MGSSRTSLPVVQDDTPLPIMGPPDDVLFLALFEAYELYMFVASLVATTVEYLFPETRVTSPPNLHVQQHNRGARWNLVVVPPPHAPVVLAHLAAREEDDQIAFNRYQRRLVLLISAFCSSVVIVLLSNLIGPANLSTAASSVGLSLDLAGVLDIVSEPVAQVAQNVAAASPSVCLFEAGLRLVCEATYGAESSILAATSL